MCNFFEIHSYRKRPKARNGFRRHELLAMIAICKSLISRDKQCISIAFYSSTNCPRGKFWDAMCIRAYIWKRQHLVCRCDQCILFSCVCCEIHCMSLCIIFCVLIYSLYSHYSHEHVWRVWWCGLLRRSSHGLGVWCWTSRRTPCRLCLVYALMMFLVMPTHQRHECLSSTPTQVCVYLDWLNLWYITAFNRCAFSTLARR